MTIFNFLDSLIGRGVGSVYGSNEYESGTLNGISKSSLVKVRDKVYEEGVSKIKEEIRYLPLRSKILYRQILYSEYWVYNFALIVFLIFLDIS